MRNLKLILPMILTLCTPAPLIFAETGCMDNSWHLAKANDHKEYHLVSCNCPCSRYSISNDRGICSECKHFRDPRPYIIIQPSLEPELDTSVDATATIVPYREKKQLHLSY